MSRQGKFSQPKPTQEAPEASPRSALDVVKTVLVYLVMTCSVAMAVFTAVSMTTVNRNDRDILGFKAYIVRSDSMSATDFSAGDLVVIREVDANTLAPGDIISFQSEDPATLGETFTHKIRQITTTEDDWPAFITYGTTTGVDDAYPVRFTSVLGKYLFRIPNMGTVFAFMKTTPGYICCIFLPFLAILLIQGGGVLQQYRLAYQQRQEEAEAEHQKQLQELEEQKKKEYAIQQKQIRYLMLEVKALKEAVAKLTQEDKRTGDG